MRWAHPLEAETVDFRMVFAAETVVAEIVVDIVAVAEIVLVVAAALPHILVVVVAYSPTQN